MKAALDELRIQNEAAKTQGMLAGQEQEYGLTGAKALIEGGAGRQAYEQSVLDAPARMAKEMADVMRGFQVPQSETTTFVGPKAGVYGMSDLQSILSVLSTLGGIRPDSKQGQSVLGKVLDKVKGLPGASTGSLADLFDINWSDAFDWEDVTGIDDTVINPVNPGSDILSGEIGTDIDDIVG
jgi:hypothetical protein